MVSSMLLEQLRQQKDSIHQACDQFGTKRIRIFGSVARGEERAESDVDMLVELPQSYDMFTQRLALQERLTEIVGRRLDLIPEHELNPHIREAVLKEAVAL
jgi:predicted nucleotidyltransferase